MLRSTVDALLPHSVKSVDLAAIRAKLAALPRWQWVITLLIGLAMGLLHYDYAWLFPIGLIGIVVALAVVERPLIGVALVLFLGPRGAYEETFVDGIVGSVTSGQLMLLFTAVIWLLQGLKNGRITLPWTHLNFPILLFATWCLFSLWYATDTMTGVREAIKWLELILIMWLILDLTRKYKPRQVLMITLGLLLAAGLIQGAYGVYQFAIAGSGPWHFAIGGRLYRAVGTLMQPNPYGGYITLNAFLSIGLLGGLIMEKSEATGEPITYKSLRALFLRDRLIQAVLITTGILCLALVGSWSRGAWINFSAGMIAVCLLMPKNKLRGIELIAVALFAGFLAIQLQLVPATFMDRLFGFIQMSKNAETLALTPETHSLLERLGQWAAGMNMAADRPWLGHGIGNYNTVYQQYRISIWNTALGHAHNYYINLMAEVGVIGLVIYLIMWSWIIGVTVRIIRYGDMLSRGVAIGMLGAWIGLSVHHFLDNMYVKNIYLHIGVMFALLAILDMQVPNARKRRYNLYARSKGKHLEEK